MADTEPGPCYNALNDAIICISGDPQCLSCYDVPNIHKTFPEDAEMAFRTTNAFIPPMESGFCKEANYRTCKPLTEDADMVRLYIYIYIYP